MSAVLEVRKLAKHFSKDGQDLVALRGFDLTVEPGTFLVLLGRSGCGKSTLLNLLAGLTSATSGQIRYQGQELTGPRTQIGYLTQHDTLMPWRDVRRNVEMPMELRGEPKKSRAAAAQALIERVGLAGYERHYPRELSGGMRRRASLARMLGGQPETLLLDEPFSALDAQLRTELQEDLLRLWSGSGRSVVFVTLDILHPPKGGGFQRSHAGFPASQATAPSGSSPVGVLHRLHRQSRRAPPRECCVPR